MSRRKSRGIGIRRKQGETDEQLKARCEAKRAAMQPAIVVVEAFTTRTSFVASEAN